MRKNIGVIKHVRDSVPKESLTLLYKTLVEPYFRHCSSVWGKCGASLIDKLQTLQNRAARAVSKVKFDETDHEQVLKSLGWLNIRQLTDFDTASLMFKTSREKMPRQTQELFTKCETIHQYNTRSVNYGKLILPKMRNLKGQRSFAFSGARFGIICQNILRELSQLDHFKKN